MELPLLSLIVFAPTAGALLLLLLPRQQHQLMRWVALGVSLLTLGLAVWADRLFDPTLPGMQLTETAVWLERWDIGYRLGMDGLSLVLVLLTTLLTPLALLSAHKAIDQRVREFLISMLLLETGMLGVFVSLDLILFYLFWEVMLVPMALIIGIWGGPRRVYAAVKFFLYTLVGSLLMLVAMVALVFQSGVQSFDLLKLYEAQIPLDAQLWMFLAFLLAFAIKVPMFPLHTWLPDAHVEAPTAGSVILAAVLLKMGTYGMLRFSLPLFPEATLVFTPWLIGLSVVGIIYGAAVALVQQDVKKLVAYSSVSHLGFVTLGIFALSEQALQGATIQMINHGLSTGALFMLVGVIYERRHTRQIAEFGGLAKSVPLFATLLVFVSLASAGLPGLNGFVGEFLVLVGSFGAYPRATTLAAFGVVLAAAYLLWMIKRMLFGPLDKPENQQLLDVQPRELLALFPLLAFIVLLGVYPKPFFERTEQSVRFVLERVEQARDARQLRLAQAPAEPEQPRVDEVRP